MAPALGPNPVVPGKRNLRRASSVRDPRFSPTPKILTISTAVPSCTVNNSFCMPYSVGIQNPVNITPPPPPVLRKGEKRMRVAVYCRVSTDDQAGSKTIENQVDFARRYCALNGLEIYDFYCDDGVSGTVPVEGRPAGSRMLADARRGCFGAVYVYRVDRLARTALDILRTHQCLDEAKVALKSMTEGFDTSTPSGKFFMTTLGGIAEIERETIAERMRLGKDRALREGRWPGGPAPYGYKLNSGRLVVDGEKARAVSSIFSLYVQGGMSTAAIADYLNATGVPSPGAARAGGCQGKKWHGGRVWGILSNPAYRGVFVFRRRGEGEQVNLVCPPIVTGEQWEEARAVRLKNSLDARKNSKKEYLLKGLIRCGLCGRLYCGDGSGSGKRRCYYRCAGSTSGRRTASRCRAKSVRADLLENIVWNDLCRFVLNDREILFRIEKNAGRQVRDDVPEDGELPAIEAAIRVKKEDRRKLIGLFRQSLISEEELRSELSGISRELEALEKRRLVVVSLEEGRACAGDLRDRMRARVQRAGPGERRDLVRGLVEGITVDMAETGGKTVPRAVISYIFGGLPDSATFVETRGKYRLGVPRSRY